jgi:hypothetical protein
MLQKCLEILKIVTKTTVLVQFGHGVIIPSVQFVSTTSEEDMMRSELTKKEKGTKISCS